MKKTAPKGEGIAIGTWPTPEKPAVKHAHRGGTAAIDTVPLPERHAVLTGKLEKLELQMGKLVAYAPSASSLEAAVAPLRTCAFHPHYRHGMTADEGAQATCDAIEAFVDCLTGKAGKAT
ncbi:hypothetical protein [Geothrix terrae]|uniref:hypothetical protein n=1 Tax=Geothrix terrae TaxID=2922720 RepID=UPI001FAC99C3|nr:hypothetical protein [Geothrix terrae]